MEPYVIRATDSKVEFWSGYRIQFGGMERHAWQKVLKAELKNALGQLVRPPESAFSGYYDSTDPRPADTENSLFTNLLATMPGEVRFLRFERGFSSPPAPPIPIDLTGGHLHYYRYHFSGSWIAWQADRTLARWDRVPRRLPDDGSARPVWFALREAGPEERVILSGEQLEPATDFGLRLVVHATKAGPGDAIRYSEKLVDGTIAAFHSDDFTETVSVALAAKLPRLTAEELRRALSCRLGPLFPTPAIRTKGSFVQISPADEHCHIGELVIIPNDSSSRWPELSGELFTITRT